MTKYYLLAFKNKNKFNPFPKIIQIVEKVDYSHVEICEVINDDWSNAYIFGSVFPKSRSIPLEEMIKHYQLKQVIPLNAKNNPKGNLISMLNKPYSLVQIVLIGLKILSKGAVSWLPYIKLNLSKDLICTELAGLFMKEACEYELDISPEMLSVQECINVAIKNLPVNEVD